jgi:hypothetical protein
MTPSTKLAVLLFCAGHTYASYFGGIAVGPFTDSNEDLFCPPGTSIGTDVVWCCPTGTQFDVLQDSSALCCPNCKQSQLTLV